jgi:hypothetical protein
MQSELVNLDRLLMQVYHDEFARFVPVAVTFTDPRRFVALDVDLIQRLLSRRDDHLMRD